MGKASLFNALAVFALVSAFAVAGVSVSGTLQRARESSAAPLPFSVVFRGKEMRAEITDPASCEWHFAGLTDEQNGALKVTPDEEEAVMDRIHEKYSNEVMSSCLDDN